MCVCTCVCVCNGGSEVSVWTGRMSTINPASDLQATAFLTLSHNPIGTAAKINTKNPPALSNEFLQHHPYIITFCYLV